MADARGQQTDTLISAPVLASLIHPQVDHEATHPQPSFIKTF
jgi:hypothetical protein